VKAWKARTPTRGVPCPYRCGPNEYPRNSKRSFRAFLIEVLASFRLSLSLVITAFVYIIASTA
jgi:hypothetical protein